MTTPSLEVMQARQWLAEQALARTNAMPIPTAPPTTFTASVADRPSLQPPGAPATDFQAALDVLQRAAGQTTAPAAPQTTVPRFGQRTLPLQSKATGWPAAPAPEKPPGLSNANSPGTLAGIGIAGGVNEGFVAGITAAQYLTWIKTGRYPTWWGPIRSLEDVEHMLNVTYSHYAASRSLPPNVREVAKWNLATAMGWVREQRAAAAARTGADPIIH